MDLTTLPANTFADMGALNNVDITETGLTTISPNAFAGLSQVTNMQLNASPLTTLQSGVFNGLSGVTNLYGQQAGLSCSVIHPVAHRDLSVNPNLATLAADVFAPLIALQYLTLQGCHLSTFPATLLTPLGSLAALCVSWCCAVLGSPTVCSAGRCHTTC